MIARLPPWRLMPMPFKSKAQARFLFANKPKLAKKFARKTRSFKRLPERSGGAFEEAVRRKVREK